MSLAYFAEQICCITTCERASSTSASNIVALPTSNAEGCLTCLYLKALLGCFSQLTGLGKIEDFCFDHSKLRDRWMLSRGSKVTDLFSDTHDRISSLKRTQTELVRG